MQAEHCTPRAWISSESLFMLCAVHTSLFCGFCSVEKKQNEGTDINNSRLKHLGHCFFFFLLISRESHRGWSPETPGERKAGCCCFTVTPSGGFFWFVYFAVELAVVWTVSKGGENLVSELVEDLAGSDPIQLHLENALRFFFVFFVERGDALRTPSQRGNGQSCRHEWSSGRPADSLIFERVSTGCDQHLFSCFVSL